MGAAPSEIENCSGNMPPRGTPKCSDLSRRPLPLHLPVFSSFLFLSSPFPLSADLFFSPFFLRYFGRALNAPAFPPRPPRLWSMRRSVFAYICSVITRGCTGVPRAARCLIAGGSGIVLFHGLTPPSGLTSRSIRPAVPTKLFSIRAVTLSPLARSREL